jgi:hypothetical protein
VEDSSRISGRVALTAFVLLGALAGCAAGTGVSTPSAPATAASETATPSAHPTPERIIINCNLVMTDADAARLTPPLIPVAGYAPAAGTLGATMVAGGAQHCGWGTGSTASVEVVVAIPTAKGLIAAKAAASTGQVAPSLRGDTIYFQVTDGVGRAQVFIGSYWIEVASAAFTTPEEAEAVYDVVIRDLRSAGG